MQFGILYLELVGDLLLVEHLDLHLLDLVEIVFNQGDVLLVVELVHFNLELRVVRLELLHHR